MILVACSKSKLDRAAPARELYTGDLFRKAAAYAETLDPRWCILSAEHHLIFNDTVIEPYETSMRDVDRAAWDRHILWQLRHFTKRPGSLSLTVLAGEDYCGWLTAFPYAVRPLKGLGIGQQKAKLKKLLEVAQ